MRRLDNAGRVCIPKDIRNNYKINSNTELQIIDNGNGILIIPESRPYILTNRNMDDLRNLYLMLKDSGLLDEENISKLAKMTRESDVACSDCGSKMFLLTNNTYKCYKCNKEDV